MLTVTNDLLRNIWVKLRQKSHHTQSSYKPDTKYCRSHIGNMYKVLDLQDRSQVLHITHDLVEYISRVECKTIVTQTYF